MKNKKQALLILAVIALYALIALRFHDALDADDHVAQTVEMNIATLEVGSEQDYQLDLTYDDPFLPKKRSWRATSVTNEVRDERGRGHQRTVSRSQRSAAVQPTGAPMPDMSLQAIIASSEGEKDICILQVDQKEVVLKENGQFQQLLVKHIYSDSVEIQYQDQALTLRITK